MASPADRMTQNGGAEPGASSPEVIRVRVITPMVFCASLVPWARASIEEETVWPRLNPRRARPGSARLLTRRARKVTVMAIRAAITGESRAGRMTLFSTVLKWMASAPPATQVAPIRPPNSACDELEGKPRYQVVRFHRIAPTSPAKITTGLMRVSSTSPPEIVLATATDRKAPARFRQPAIATATLGRSAPVAMEVAMALAVSWKPLVKSKISAVSTTTITITIVGMSILRHSGCRVRVDRCRDGVALSRARTSTDGDHHRGSITRTRSAGSLRRVRTFTDCHDHSLLITLAIGRR